LEKYFIETAHALALRHPDDVVTIVTFNEARTEMLQHLLSFYYWKKMPVANIYREKTEDILSKLGPVRYVKCRNFQALREVIADANLVYAKNEIIDLAILRFFGGKHLPPIIAGIHTPLFFPIADSFHARLHNMLYTGWLYRFLLKKVSAVHTINQSAKRIIEESHFAGRVYPIANPFVGKNFSVTHHKTSEFRVLYAGRISREKGLDVVLGCIGMILAQKDSQHFRFHIAGTGDERYVGELLELSRAYPLQVSYLGYVANDHIHELYEWSDVVLAPSHFETMPYAILEAGASGKLVLASDIPGPQDIILDGETGFLLPLSIEHFVTKLSELAYNKKEDPGYLTHLSERIKGHISECFRPEKVYQQFDTMIREVSAYPTKKKSV